MHDPHTSNLHGPDLLVCYLPLMCTVKLSLNIGARANSVCLFSIYLQMCSVMVPLNVIERVPRLCSNYVALSGQRYVIVQSISLIQWFNYSDLRCQLYAVCKVYIRILVGL